MNEFDRLVLRNGGQDIVRAMFRDAFVHEVVRDCNLEVMHSNPTVLFLKVLTCDDVRMYHQHIIATYFSRGAVSL